eukprot:CAMPEP_0182550544 /NCGR_PEP_ID=MMETSP1323-20130603/41760_1 /TAXON_ID=236787 /ORGANISM="Florenciella parvula, Strain RCC1693" /LENGTH=90 /DNA_ID=CAMNT_0024762081 /DNA_START=44 /DNA_END=313 /DNA_ORIENTATION=+
MKLADQLDMYSTTDMLISAHGAVLTNAMFLRDGAALIEVFNCRHGSGTYRVIVESRHLFYIAARESGAREYLTAKIDCQASDNPGIDGDV